jgi:hypothetical protein
VKAARLLASDITQSGAKLYDLLANEVNERYERMQTLRFLDQAGTAFGKYPLVVVSHHSLRLLLYAV